MPVKGMPVNIKKGGLSRDERLYIEKFLSIKSDEELGKELKRSPNQISKYRKELEDKKNNIGGNEKLREQYLADFRAHTDYDNLKKQFTKEEFIAFESKYVGMVCQFEGARYTEQDQVFDYITCSIFIDRIGEEQLFNNQEIKRTSKLIDQLIGEGRAKEKENLPLIEGLHAQLATLKSMGSAKNKEYNDLSKRKEETLKQLKGTREQRTKKEADAKFSVTGLMRFLDEEDSRREVEIETLLNRAAREKEKERLGKLHTYENGEVDRPMLTSETIKYGQETSETPAQT